MTKGMMPLLAVAALLLAERPAFLAREVHWYDVLTWEPRLGEYLWLGPGRFGEGGKSAIKALWIDKIAFRPCH